MKKIIASIFLILLMAINTDAEIILSEVLSNEPSNRVYLEWFEIYNNGAADIDLSDYIVIETGDTLDIPDGSIIEPFTYAVFCRRLEPDNGSDCFEFYWGDSSGIWGDSPDEDYAVYEVNMSLTNSSGSIYIMRQDSTGVDHFIWEEASDDGRSVERDDVLSVFSGWHECFDMALSTPGRENSSEPSNRENYFLEIIPEIVRYSDGDRNFTINYATPSGTEINLYVYDDSALKRATLEEESPSSIGQCIWDITDDDGITLKPGLYFLLFRTTGEVNVNKTIPIVIAP